MPARIVSYVRNEWVGNLDRPNETAERLADSFNRNRWVVTQRKDGRYTAILPGTSSHVMIEDV